MMKIFTEGLPPPPEGKEKIRLDISWATSLRRALRIVTRAYGVITIKASMCIVAAIRGTVLPAQIGFVVHGHVHLRSQRRV